MDELHWKNRAPQPERGLLEGVLDSMTVLRRYRRSIAACTAGAAVLMTLFCALTLVLPSRLNPLPNQYTANATLFIRQDPPVTLAADALASLSAESSAAYGPTGFEYSFLLLRMLQSRVIQDQIVREFDLVHRYNLGGEIVSKSRLALKKKSRFTYARDSGTLTLSFQDTDPVLARDITNRYVALLGTWSAETWGSSMQRQKGVLQEKLAQVEQNIAALDDQRKSLQRKYGFLNAQELGASRAAMLSSLRTQLVLKDVEIRTYGSFAGKEDPHLQQLKAERQNIMDSITQSEAGAEGGKPSSVSSGDLPDVAQRFADLSQQVDVQRGLATTLSRDLEVTKLSAEAQPIFRVLEMAEIPDSKSGPVRTRLILVVTILALAASIMASFVRHTLGRMKGRSPAPRTLGRSS
jgi:tyrosine-protein kinase Etk/Wzc